jgi:hypothetical protein
VGLQIPQSVFDALTPVARRLVRFEPIVPDEVAASYDGVEKYDAKTLTYASGQSIAL